MGKDLSTLLQRDFGLSRLLVQNDISEDLVIKLLIEAGHINLHEYFYQDETRIWDDD